MIFPEEILPNENFKIIECELSSYSLIRFTPTKDIKDETGLVKDKMIADPSITHLPDLSTSLFGVFLIAYIPIKIVNRYYNSYCEPNIKEKTPIIDDDFVLENERGYWFIKIGDIIEKIADYKYSDNDLQAVCKVIHTPTKWNFWHFSIRWFLINENTFWNDLPDNEKSKKWSRKLAHETRSLVRFHANTNIPESIELNPSCYSN